MSHARTGAHIGVPEVFDSNDGRTIEAERLRGSEYRERIDGNSKDAAIRSPKTLLSEIALVLSDVSAW